MSYETFIAILFFLGVGLLFGVVLGFKPAIRILEWLIFGASSNDNDVSKNRRKPKRDSGLSQKQRVQRPTSKRR